MPPLENLKKYRPLRCHFLHFEYSFETTKSTQSSALTLPKTMALCLKGTRNSRYHRKMAKVVLKRLVKEEKHLPLPEKSYKKRENIEQKWEVSGQNRRVGILEYLTCQISSSVIASCSNQNCSCSGGITGFM